MCEDHRDDDPEQGTVHGPAVREEVERAGERINRRREIDTGALTDLVRLMPEPMKRQYHRILQGIVRERQYPKEWNEWIAVLAMKPGEDSKKLGRRRDLDFGTFFQSVAYEVSAEVEKWSGVAPEVSEVVRHRRCSSPTTRCCRATMCRPLGAPSSARGWWRRWPASTAHNRGADRESHRARRRRDHVLLREVDGGHVERLRHDREDAHCRPARASAAVGRTRSSGTRRTLKASCATSS